MKAVTPWSKASKQATDWTHPATVAAQWTDNDATPSAVWSNNDVKSPTDWGVPPALLQTYFYDDINRTYDDAGYEYDFIVDGNTFSNRNQTIWAAA
jgi:hypothetical protein